MQFGNAISIFKYTVPGDLISTNCNEIAAIISQHRGEGDSSELNR